MDPRHPEQAITRMRELMKQYDRIEDSMNKTNSSAELAALEREGSLVVQEICLVAPRIHEAMMQTSRMRRREISRGVVEKPVQIVTDVENPDGKIAVHNAKPEEYIEKPKKKATKKKTTKKKAE